MSSDIENKFVETITILYLLVLSLFISPIFQEYFDPLILIMVFTFFKTNQFERKCLGLYIFLNIFIFSIFFILPRYKLIILPMQIILASNFITYMLKKYAPK